MNRNSIYDRDLPRRAANWQPLTPVSFLERAATTYADFPAVVYGHIRYSYRELYKRCRQLASALAGLGVQAGETVSVLAPNVPAMVEAHFGVPMIGAVLNTINTRLDPEAISFILGHGEAKVLLVDVEFMGLLQAALESVSNPPTVVVVEDLVAGLEAPRQGLLTYEQLLARGDPAFSWSGPDDEWQAMCLNYTSGTTGDPKGVVYHCRGVYLNSIGNALTMSLTPGSVYLWTLPMFHCNGWHCAWISALCGVTQVCLRRVQPSEVLSLIGSEGVTHLCGAPIVLRMVSEEAEAKGIRFDPEIFFGTGGAAPSSSVISKGEAVGFRVTHLYGMTELLGTATHCFHQPGWLGLSEADRMKRMLRQGSPHPLVAGVRVANPETGEDLPWNGEEVGELMFRGNTVMKGYLKNPNATQKALEGGWLKTGDLAVIHPDGYVEIRDREKDVIISGGENISSLELEELLSQHPDVSEVAVVARQDEKWGESPCAFVNRKAGATVTENELIRWCRDRIAHFKAPRSVIFSELPKTATGKIIKVQLRERANAQANV